MSEKTNETSTTNCSNDGTEKHNIEAEEYPNEIITNYNNNNTNNKNIYNNTSNSSRNKIETNEILKKSKQISSSTTSLSSTESTKIEIGTDRFKKNSIKSDNNKLENCDTNTNSNNNIIIKENIIKTNESNELLKNKTNERKDNKTEIKLNNQFSNNIFSNKINACETKLKTELEIKNNLTNSKIIQLPNPIKIKIIEVNSLEAKQFNETTNNCKILSTTLTNLNLNNDLHTKVINDLKKLSPAKSILYNGQAWGQRKSSLKKSVSFDPDDETIKKFIEGEIIVDKKNPFKNGFIPNGSSYEKLSDTKNSNKKSVFKLRKDKDKNNKFSILNSTETTPTTLNAESEFITTEEVLNQSKYVKTYIKNPDKCFIYDPTVLQRLKYEELKEFKNKEKSKEKKINSSRFSQQTQLRVKEYKNKCSIVNGTIPFQTKLIKSATPKLPTFKKVSKPNYPDLSDIKVKTGTDLEESLFSPEEVHENAKKFDERIKALHIGSDEDLEEIDEPLTKSDSSDETKLIITTTELSNNIISQQTTTETIQDTTDSGDINDPSKSFTNTVNSKEFKEYLDRKGLQLIPQHQLDEKNIKKNILLETRVASGPESAFATAKSIDSTTIKYNTKTRITEKNLKSINKSPLFTTAEMDQKKHKKQSVLQRIKSSGFFSSKRKTTPKELVPTHIPYPVIKENGHKATTASLTINNKRVTLERQSFHGSSGNSLNSSNEFKKHLERSRKSYAAGDDGSSSISSALTNSDIIVPDEITITPLILQHPPLQQQHAQPQQHLQHNCNQVKQYRGTRSSSRSNDSDTINTCNSSSTTNQQRSRSTSRDRLQNLYIKSQQYEVRESPMAGTGGGNLIVKPKVQRPLLPINSLKLLPIKSSDCKEKQQQQLSAIPLQQRSLERQSMVQRKVITPNNEDYQLCFNRSTSMDRHEISKRSENRVQSSSLPKPSRQSITSQRSSSSISTPKNSKETLLDPRNTSTPIRNDSTKEQREKSTQKPVSINASHSNVPYNVGIKEWNKLKEIKEKTDRELFNRAALTINKHETSGSYITTKPENIYEKVPIPKEHHQQFEIVVPQEQQQNYYQTQQAQPQIGKSYQVSDSPLQPLYTQLISDHNFVRGSAQRNTFSGVSLRHRNAKIVDGNAVNISENYIIPIKEVEPPQNITAHDSYPSRCQSVLDELLTPVYHDHKNSNTNYSGRINSVEIESSGTPVRVRIKETSANLTREEILQKVKEFCRKSMNKTPTKLSVALSPQQQISLSQQQMSYSEINGKIPSDVSPISYTSVNSYKSSRQNAGNVTPQRKVLAPQVPKRIQSLPHMHQISTRDTTPSTSPIYAHVIKRNSIQSNMSDTVDSPTRYQNTATNIIYSQPNTITKYATTHSPNRNMALNRQRLQPQIIETDSVFSSNGKIPPQHNLSQKIYLQQKPQSISETNRSSSSSQYIIMETDKITPNQVIKYQNSQVSPLVTTSSTNIDLYGNIMPPSSPYAYIHLKSAQGPSPSSSTGSQHLPLRSSRIDGRSTPLILERSVNGPHKGSQIYWTPMQHSPRPLHHSPIPRFSHINKQQQPYSPNSTIARQNYNSLSQSQQHQLASQSNKTHSFLYESESGSEAGEVQKIMQGKKFEDWQNDKSGRNQPSDQGDDRRRGTRREDPRRHTLGADMLQYGSAGQIAGSGGVIMQQSNQQQQRAMDLEGQSVRGYTPINQGPLFDEDPGIMSEVETASTGFRRGNKQRSSLPVVRTPSKTLERPLGLVFLQYRSETKRALLPNEITSIDTVRALFVRSFPRQLTMAYLEGPNVKIYIHDASKDMFYELEDVRSHLREIRDRSVLRLFESNEVAAPQVLPGGPGIPQPLPQPQQGHWDQDQSYFSEPEFDSEYQHQHIHKSKVGKQAPYYVGAQTLPRGMYSDRNKNAVVDGYASSPERGTRGAYEEPYYSQYGTRGAPIAPIITEEQRCDSAMTEDEYALYGMKVSGRIPRNASQLYDPTRPEDLHRIRVEHMERQLANLTGLVQKALVNQNPQIITHPAAGVLNPNFLGVPGQCRDKSVSFEKSVSFSDDIQGVPKSHSPQHAAERDRLKPPPPPKPLALAQTHPNYRPDIALAPEVYNHLRGLQKKAKDLRIEVRTLRRLSQAQAVAVREDIKDAFMRIRATLLAGSGNFWGQGDQEKTRISREEELYKQEVIRLENDLSDLESSVEGLRGEVINRRTRVNMAAVEDMALVLSRASKTVAELKMKFPTLQNGLRNILSNEMEKVVREEKFLKDEPDRLESALRRCKKLTGTLVTLKRLASVQEQRVPVNEPTTEDPPRSSEIPSTNKPIPSPRMGTITVSGGIPPENALDALLDELQTFAKPQNLSNEVQRPDDSTSDDSSQTLHNTITTQLSQSSLYTAETNPNTLQPNPNGPISSLRRLHSYPSGSDTDTSPPQPIRPVGKPPVPERNAELLTKVGSKRIPPPPPPRTSSRSPLASPTSPNVPQRLQSVNETEQIMVGNGNSINNISGIMQQDGGESSGNESGNDHTQRQLALEMRHQELLKKQKMLQDQYARLQQMSKNSVALQSTDIKQLKKTGSESNLPQKMGLNMSVTGSMKNLNNSEINNVNEKNEKNLINSNNVIEQTKIGSGGVAGGNDTGNMVEIKQINLNNIQVGQQNAQHQHQKTTTSKVYETDIL